MNNKLRFILPRLAGAVLVAGIASVIIFTLFKLLALALIIAIVVAAIKGITGRRYGEHRGHFGHNTAEELQNRAPQYSHPAYGPLPVSRKQHPAIIPIN